MKVFDKYKTAFDLFKLILHTSRRLDLKAIQEKYGFNKQRRIKLTIHDSKRSFYIQLRDGKLHPLQVLSREFDNEVEIDRLYTLKYIVNGEKPALSPKQTLCYTDYALMDGWTNGEITSDGKASTNLVFCVVDVVTECIKAIPADELNKILPDENDEYLQEILGIVKQKRRQFTVQVT